MKIQIYLASSETVRTVICVAHHNPFVLLQTAFSTGPRDGCIRWISWLHCRFSQSLLFHVLMRTLFAASARIPPKVLTRRLPRIRCCYDVVLIYHLSLNILIYAETCTCWKSVPCAFRVYHSWLWNKQQRKFKPQYHLYSFHWQRYVLFLIQNPKSSFRRSGVCCFALDDIHIFHMSSDFCDAQTILNLLPSANRGNAVRRTPTTGSG